MVNTFIASAARGFVLRTHTQRLQQVAVQSPVAVAVRLNDPQRYRLHWETRANQHMIVVTFPTGHYLQLALIKWRCWRLNLARVAADRQHLYTPGLAKTSPHY